MKNYPGQRRSPARGPPPPARFYRPRFGPPPGLASEARPAGVALTPSARPGAPHSFLSSRGPSLPTCLSRLQMLLIHSGALRPISHKLSSLWGLPSPFPVLFLCNLCLSVSVSLPCMPVFLLNSLADFCFHLFALCHFFSDTFSLA